MALVVPKVGELELLNKMLISQLATDENYILKLYNNDITPDKNSVASIFNEAVFTGYTSKILLRSNWSSPIIISDKAISSYPQQNWTCGVTGDTIYGYFVVGANSGILLWAERFDQYKTLSYSDILIVTPVFTLISEN
jgi:hypothetical protein